MSSLNFTPAQTNLVLWRGNTDSFAVRFTSSGTATDVTGDWVASFDDGTGTITVDDSAEATGVITVTVAVVPASALTRWELRRGGQTLVAGEVIVRG